MTDQSVFDNSANTNSQTQPQVNDLFANQLQAIKNENGQPKYATVEKALEALAHAQGYIPELKTENQAKDEIIETLKAELAKKQSMEDLVNRLAQPQATPQTGEKPSQANVLDPNVVVQQVLNQLESKSQADTMKANRQKVEEFLVSKFGDKTKEVIQAKAQELGLTPQKIGELASSSPQAALALFNGGAAPAPSVTTGSVTIPGYKKEEYKPLERPAKSLLAGATAKEQAEYMRKIREDVYRKHGIDPN